MIVRKGLVMDLFAIIEIIGKGCRNFTLNELHLPKNMKKAVLLEDPRPERPCCVRLEMTSTLPLVLSSIISYTPSSYTTGVFRSKGKSETKIDKEYT